MSEAQETWTWRELPILREALRRVDLGEQMIEFEVIREAVGIMPGEMLIGAQALADADPPYLTVYRTGGMSGGMVRDVTERTRRELGSWPSPEALVDRLVETLRDAAAAEPEPERKGKLQAAADALGGFARDVAVQVVAARIGTL